MNSNSPEMERLRNPTHFGGEGLYDPPGAEEASSLKVRLSDHLDSSVKRSLLTDRSTYSARDFVARNRLPMWVAVGGLVWLLVALMRQSLQGSSRDDF